MSTGHTFGELNIPGTIPAFAVPSQQGETWRTKFPAVDGVSEVRGAPGARSIKFRQLLYAAAIDSVADMQSLVLDIGIAQDTNATLEIFGSNAQTYPFCTLDEFVVLGACLPDVAGSLGVGAGAYFLWVEFSYTQLAPA